MVTFAQTIGLFFTGSYVPIPLFPTWLRTISDWLPFNGLMNIPTEDVVLRRCPVIPCPISREIVRIRFMCRRRAGSPVGTTYMPI